MTLINLLMTTDYFLLNGDLAPLTRQRLQPVLDSRTAMILRYGFINDDIRGSASRY